MRQRHERESLRHCFVVVVVVVFLGFFFFGCCFSF